MDSNNFFTIGIDLGTSLTCSGGYNGRFSIIENEDGRELVNYMTIKPDDFLIGEISKQKMRSNFMNTVYDCKTLLAKNYDDPFIQENLKRWPFKLVKSEQGRIRVVVGNDEFEPEQIIALLIDKIKDLAEKKFNKKVDSCVITVPCSFTDSERQAVIDSARIAEIPNVYLVNDNTAIAITLAYENKLLRTQNILIFNLGAYYLNLSICDIINGCIIVKASKSYPHMGGRIIDFNMAQKIISGLNIESSEFEMKKFFQVLTLECEKAKIKLSDRMSTDIVIESILPNRKDLNFNFSRNIFDDINVNLFMDYLERVKDLLNEINLPKEQVGEIIMVGGSSRIPKVRDLLTQYFSKNVNLSQNASEAVAYGAIIRAGFLSNQNLSSNNGFIFEDINTHRYILKITMNGKEKFELDTWWLSKLPIAKDMVIYSNNQKMKFQLELYEGNNFIYRNYLILDHIEWVCFILQVGKSGIVDVKIKLKSVQREQIQKLNDPKKNCLSNDEKGIIYKWIKNQKERQEKLRQIQNKKNDIESNCYNLKEWLESAKSKFYFSYFVLNKQIEDIWISLKSENTNLDTIEEKLKHLTIIQNDFIKDNNKLEGLNRLRLQINVLIFKLENLKNQKDGDRLHKLNVYQFQLSPNEINSNSSLINKELITNDLFKEEKCVKNEILNEIKSFFETLRKHGKITEDNFNKICKEINQTNLNNKDQLQKKLQPILGRSLMDDITSNKYFNLLWNLF